MFTAEHAQWNAREMQTEAGSGGRLGVLMCESPAHAPGEENPPRAAELQQGVDRLVAAAALEAVRLVAHQQALS